MVLFAIFIFCLTTPWIVDAGQTQGDCICVDATFCADQFISIIRPRSLRQECNVGTQVCCRPEHITKYPNLNLQTPSNYNPNTPQCGRKNPIPKGYGRLIQPNSVAYLGEIPWQVAVLRNSSKATFLIASGVLLNRFAILTSAHTLNDLYSDQVIARLGENNFQADPSRKYPALNAKISRITINPDFNRNTLANDFAVLCLKSPVRLSQTINPVCLPDPGDFIGDSSQCVVSGWGKNSLYGNYSAVLRKSNVNLVPNDICGNLIKNRVQDPNFNFRSTSVCAITKDGRDATCTGDAGDPLTCTNKNGREVLVGLSSWGINCGEKNIPGVYSNVRYPSVYEWLKTTVQDCIPTNPPVDYNYQSSTYNSDYQVVNYNSNNNYNSNQNYNGQSDYNSVNSNYNNNNNYNNNYNSNPSLNYNPINNQNYNDQSNYNQLNNNYDNDFNSIGYRGRSKSESKSATENFETTETEAVSKK